MKSFISIFLLLLVLTITIATNNNNNKNLFFVLALDWDKVWLPSNNYIRQPYVGETHPFASELEKIENCYVDENRRSFYFYLNDQGGGGTSSTINRNVLLDIYLCADNSGCAHGCKLHAQLRPGDPHKALKVMQPSDGTRYAYYWDGLKYALPHGVVTHAEYQAGSDCAATDIILRRPLPSSSKICIPPDSTWTSSAGLYYCHEYSTASGSTLYPEVTLFVDAKSCHKDANKINYFDLNGDQCEGRAAKMLCSRARPTVFAFTIIRGDMVEAGPALGLYLGLIKEPPNYGGAVAGATIAFFIILSIWYCYHRKKEFEKWELEMEEERKRKAQEEEYIKEKEKKEGKRLPGAMSFQTPGVVPMPKVEEGSPTNKQPVYKVLAKKAQNQTYTAMAAGSANGDGVNNMNASNLGSDQGMSPLGSPMSPSFGFGMDPSSPTGGQPPSFGSPSSPDL